MLDFRTVTLFVIVSPVTYVFPTQNPPCSPSLLPSLLFHPKPSHCSKFRKAAASSLAPPPPPSPFTQTALSLLKADTAQSLASSPHFLSRLLGHLPSSFTSQLPHWSPSLAAWVLPFPGADASVVRRSRAAYSAAGQQQHLAAARVPLVGGTESLAVQESFQGRSSCHQDLPVVHPFFSPAHPLCFCLQRRPFCWLLTLLILLLLMVLPPVPPMSPPPLPSSSTLPSSLCPQHSMHRCL